MYARVCAGINFFFYGRDFLEETIGGGGGNRDFLKSRGGGSGSIM